MDTIVVNLSFININLLFFDKSRRTAAWPSPLWALFICMWVPFAACGCLSPATASADLGFREPTPGDTHPHGPIGTHTGGEEHPQSGGRCQRERWLHIRRHRAERPAADQTCNKLKRDSRPRRSCAPLPHRTCELIQRKPADDARLIASVTDTLPHHIMRAASMRDPLRADATQGAKRASCKNVEGYTISKRRLFTWWPNSGMKISFSL